MTGSGRERTSPRSVTCGSAIKSRTDFTAEAITTFSAHLANRSCVVWEPAQAAIVSCRLGPFAARSSPDL
jgi:hypothetical protein